MEKVPPATTAEAVGTSPCPRQACQPNLLGAGDGSRVQTPELDFVLYLHDCEGAM